MINVNERNKQIDELRKRILKMIRIYLKVEWSRVKLESSVCKFKHWSYWRPFKGFISEKALEKYNNDYID